MTRRSRSARPRSFRRTKLFVLANLLLWAAIGGWYLFQPEERQTDIARLVRSAFDSRKQVSALEVAWDLWQIYGSKDTVRAVAPGDRTHVYGGAPVLANGRPVRVLVNTGYVVGYSDELGDPLWSAYRVRDIDLTSAPPRPESFTVDARTTVRVQSEDYVRSGFDRGHLAPNFAIATRYGREAQEETFLMSNIVPQKHTLNAGSWERLEHRIATNYAARFGEVWVIAGPVFSTNPERLKQRVAVPEAFYMIVVDELEGRVRAEGFLFSQDTPENDPLEKHVASIDEIESRTGLDFLSELPDDGETALEARQVARVW